MTRRTGIQDLPGRLAGFAVEHYRLTLIVFLALLAAGAASLSGIPKSEDPNFPIPTFLIVASHPGADPEAMEEQIVDPIETGMAGLDDIKRISSTMEDGLATIKVEFMDDASADAKYQEVSGQLNALRPGLLGGLKGLRIERYNTANVNIIQYAIVSATASDSVLWEKADGLKRLLEGVKGIHRAETWACANKEVLVALDFAKLSRLRIPISHVQHTLNSGNQGLPAGTLESGGRKFNLKAPGSFASVGQIAGLVIESRDGRNIHLGDVAEVKLHDKTPTHLARYNGRRAAFVTANQNPGENIFRVRKGIEAAIGNFKDGLGPDIRLETGFDQSLIVSGRLESLGWDFLLALLLVSIVMLSLGRRASLIAMVSIPLSLAFGLALLRLTGQSLNQLSIVGLILSLGLVVDDSIIVIENITRFRRSGLSRVEAATKATGQIGVAVVGCTATMILAFVPLLMLPGPAGEYIRSMPLALTFSVLASLFVALTIIPFLASVWLPRTPVAGENALMRALVAGVERTYGKWLQASLLRPRLVMAFSICFCLAGLALMPIVGFSLFPKSGTPQLLVTIQASEGSTLAATDAICRFAESVLAGSPDVKDFMTNVGRGNPLVYYNVPSRNEKPNIGEIFVRLKVDGNAATEKAASRLQAGFDGYAGARIEVREFRNGPYLEAPIALRIIGKDIDSLKALAGRAADLIARTPGTAKVENPLQGSATDLVWAVDAEKAGMLGVTIEEIGRTLRIGLAGVDAGRLRDRSGKEHAVRLGLKGRSGGFSDLDGLGVDSRAGRQVLLGQVGKAGFRTALRTINHINRERSVTVSADVLPGHATDKVSSRIRSALGSLRIPAGYRLETGGEQQNRRESFEGAGFAALLAGAGILIVLLLEFKTFRAVAAVASVIPVGISGGLMALFVTGNSLSFTAAIGFIALTGIEIKNSILLVDYANRLRGEGMSLDEAIRKAGEVRFIPILLTTLTALGGFIPIAMEGSALYSPLAIVIIGGLASSTFLTRLVTPVAYKLLVSHEVLPPRESFEPETRAIARAIAGIERI